MTRLHRAQQGYTLIELIVVVTILAAITGGITSAFLTAYNANVTSDERVHESNDAQVLAGYWTADAQAAGGVNPVVGATDASLGVSTGSDNGCTGPGGGALVFSFKWNDRSASSVVARVANYFYTPSNGALERRTCADGASTSATLLTSRVAAVPTTACTPNCGGLPSTVTITVSEAPPGSAPTYTFSLTAKVRPDGQTAPTSSNASSSPLIALGGAPCNPGDTTTGLEIGGSPTVVVNGATVVNATN